MTSKSLTTDDVLRLLDLPPHEQFTLATSLASNVGYALIEDGSVDPTPSKVETGLIKPSEINKVMLLAQVLRAGPNERLTIITHALVAMTKAYGFDLETLIDNIEKCYDDSHDLEGGTALQ